MARLRRLPPIHALLAFESAARLGGFAPAAAELCITPSAISHRIRQLEAQLGEQLFERTASGVRLTDAGQHCLVGVREAFDRLASLSRSNPHDEVVRLVVGTPPTFARNLLIPRLPEFQRLWPDIEIELAIGAPMQDRPERHDVDIRFGSGLFDERLTVKLYDDRLDVLVSPAFLQRHPAVTRPAELAGLELLRSPLVPWQPWFRAAGLHWPEPQRGTIFTDLGALLEAAASGLGLAVCSRRIAERWIRDGQLIFLFPDLEVPSTNTYHVLVERDLAPRPEVAAFTDWLRSTFA
jgi:DNA-binding transcriptional LysR family regulator